MTLNEYLAAKGLKQSEFSARLALRLGAAVAPQSMSRWSRRPGTAGYGIPEPDIIAAIHRETRGQVTAASWYRHVLPAQRKAS